MPAIDYLIKFDAIAWEPVMPGVRHKVHRVGARMLRLVEYAHDMPPHWCERGHIGHIVKGRMEIEFKTGTQRFDTGDAVFIPAGPEHAHRARAISHVVTALFVEDV